MNAVQCRNYNKQQIYLNGITLVETRIDNTNQMITISESKLDFHILFESYYHHYHHVCFDISESAFCSKLLRRSCLSEFYNFMNHQMVVRQRKTHRKTFSNAMVTCGLFDLISTLKNPSIFCYICLFVSLSFWFLTLVCLFCFCFLFIFVHLYLSN